MERDRREEGSEKEITTMVVLKEIVQGFTTLLY